MTDDPKKPKSAYETMSDARAAEFYREDPGASLRGERLMSAETGEDEGTFHGTPEEKSKAVVVLAMEQRERFLELVGYLPHAIQDIFIQFYLLERTQEQIGETLGMSQTAIWQALKLGMEAMCAVMLYGDDCLRLENIPKQAADAYAAMLAWTTEVGQREELVLRTPKNVGEFEIRVDDETLELHFAPSTRRGR